MYRYTHANWMRMRLRERKLISNCHPHLVGTMCHRQTRQRNTHAIKKSQSLSLSFDKTMCEMGDAKQKSV